MALHNNHKTTLLVLEARAADRVGLAERGGGALRVALDEEGDEEKASGWFTGSVTTEPSESEEEKEEELPKMAAERVSVELGLVDEQLAEIVKGIDVGDQIVVIGQSNLKDGALIRTPEMLPDEPKSEDAKEEGTEEAQ